VTYHCVACCPPFQQPFVRSAGGGLDTARDAFRPDAFGVAGAHSAGQTPGRRPARRARSHAQAKPSMASGVDRSEHPGIDAHFASAPASGGAALRASGIVTRMGGDTSWWLRRRIFAAIERGPGGETPKPGSYAAVPIENQN
jgi:hypothetical protein